MSPEICPRSRGDLPKTEQCVKILSPRGKGVCRRVPRWMTGCSRPMLMCSILSSSCMCCTKHCHYLIGCAPVVGSKRGLSGSGRAPELHEILTAVTSMTNWIVSTAYDKIGSSQKSGPRGQIRSHASMDFIWDVAAILIVLTAQCDLVDDRLEQVSLMHGSRSPGHLRRDDISMYLAHGRGHPQPRWLRTYCCRQGHT